MERAWPLIAIDLLLQLLFTEHLYDIYYLCFTDEILRLGEITFPRSHSF